MIAARRNKMVAKTEKVDIDVRTWFIADASRGLGSIWADAALSRGDRVAATARRLADLADLRGTRC